MLLKPSITFLLVREFISTFEIKNLSYLDRVKRIWYLSPMRAAKVQASLRIRAVSPEPSLLAHTSSESRGTFRQKARSLAPLNGWACAVKVCHDGMLEDTNSLDAAHLNTKNMVGKQTPWYLSFVYMSRISLTIQTTKIWKTLGAILIIYVRF